MCHFWELTCKIGEVVTEASDNIIAQWTEAVLNGLSDAMIALGSAWITMPTPGFSASTGVVDWVQERLTLVTLALAIGSIMLAGIKVAWEKRAEPARDLVRSLFTLVIVSTVGVTVARLLVTASDTFSVWILAQVVGDDNGEFLVSILRVSSLTGSVGMIVLLLGGLVALVADLAMMGLLFVRAAMLILLVGVLPAAAAATNTRWGQEWLTKVAGWTVAFVAFKPAASIIYALAVKLVAGDSWNIAGDGEFTKFVLGVILMVLAPFALPSLVTFMVPATAAMSSGGGGGGAALAGVAGAAATGAAQVTRMAASSSSDGGSTGGSGGSASGASYTASDSAYASQTGSETHHTQNEDRASTQTSSGGAGAASGAPTGGADGDAGGSAASAGADAGVSASGAAGSASAGQVGGGASAGASASGAAAGAAGLGPLGAAVVVGKEVADGAAAAAHDAVDESTGAGEESDT